MTSVRVAVIGTGWAATTLHLPGMVDHPDADVVAVCDPMPGRAEQVADQFGVGHACSDPEDLLGSGRAEAVIIATPHASHFSLTRRALSTGHHVLVEKPLTTDADDAFALVRQAEASGLHFAVGYTYQYAETAPRVRQAVQHEIGDLVQVIAQFSSNAGSLYAAAEFGDDPRPDVPHPSAYAAQQGGGQARTQLTHVMGMVCWATGREIDRVQGFSENRGLGVDVDGAASFSFVGGGLGVAATTGTSNGRMIKHHVRYIGTDGVVDQNMLTAEVQIIHADQVERVGPTSEPTYRAQQPARSFVELVAGRRGVNQSPGRPAAACVAFVEALLSAADSGSTTAVRRLPGARPVP